MGLFDLTGRVALVTGAGQNVGAGIAETLADCGASVAVNDLYEDRAEAEAKHIMEAGGTALATPFDVRHLDDVRGAAARIEADLGPIDILVNNAGIVQEGPRGLVKFRDLDPEEWHRSIELNIYGVLNCVKATIDGMCDRHFGRVVTISSGAGTQGLGIGVSTYAAGKGGAIGFMRHLALETAKFGVTANTLALGLMENAAGGAAGLPVAPVGRAGSGRDVGAAVVWLAAEGEWVTGQTIGINGGSSTT
jgi:NAD(P)-dependent dehydrogenase (short-subunit alcohol dehydrogenase family)